jgi:hypothetical protein
MAVSSTHKARWQTWPEVEIKLHGIPRGMSTLDLWQLFQDEGALDMVEMYGSSTLPFAMGKMRFRQVVSSK